MKPERQQIAIVEACPGLFEKTETGWYYLFCGQWVRCVNGSILSDLNAMHEAEEAVILKEHPSIQADYKHRLSVLSNYKYWHATASQRAEAFLRTNGKWEDE